MWRASISFASQIKRNSKFKWKFGFLYQNITVWHILQFILSINNEIKFWLSKGTINSFNELDSFEQSKHRNSFDLINNIIWSEWTQCYWSWNKKKQSFFSVSCYKSVKAAAAAVRVNVIHVHFAFSCVYWFWYSFNRVYVTVFPMYFIIYSIFLIANKQENSAWERKPWQQHTFRKIFFLLHFDTFAILLTLSKLNWNWPIEWIIV